MLSLVLKVLSHTITMVKFRKMWLWMYYHVNNRYFEFKCAWCWSIFFLLYWLHNLQLPENSWEIKVWEFSVIQMVVEAVDVTYTTYEVCVKLGRRPLWGPLQHHVKDKGSQKREESPVVWGKVMEEKVSVRCQMLQRERWDPKGFEFGGRLLWL